MFHHAGVAIHISLFQKSVLGKDRFLGMVAVPFSSVLQWKYLAQWFTLEKRSDKSNVAGELFLTVVYSPTCPSIKCDCYRTYV